MIITDLFMEFPNNRFYRDPVWHRFWCSISIRVHVPVPEEPPLWALGVDWSSRDQYTVQLVRTIGSDDTLVLAVGLHRVGRS